MLAQRKILTSFIITSTIFLFSPRIILAQVVINEFLVNPNPEWVEFYNASESAEFLKNYWLDDDRDFNDDTGSSPKKSLANLNIDNPTYPYLEFNSFLNNTGDYVVLFDSEGNEIDYYQYKASPGEGVSIGRSPDASGDFVVLENSTRGGANSNPIPTATPTPTLTPTSTPTPKPPTPTPEPPTPTPTREVASPTPIPKKVKLIATMSGEILGEKEREATTAFYPWEATEEAEPKEATPSGSQRKILPIIFLGLGLTLLAAAAFWVWYNFGRNYRGK